MNIDFSKINIKEIKDLLVLDEARKKVLIIGLTVAIALIVDIFFIFIPLIGQSFRLKSKIVALKKDISSLDEQISNADTTKKRLAILTVESEKVAKSFPREEEVPALLGNISTIAAKLGLDIIAVRPAKTAAAMDPALAARFHEVPVEITAKGGYHQLGQFMHKLETFEKFIEVKDVEIVADRSSPRRHSIKILVSTYIMKV